MNNRYDLKVDEPVEPDLFCDWIPKAAIFSLCLLLLPTLCCALQVSPAQGVYAAPDGAVITHVFYCSLDKWEEVDFRDIAVSTTNPWVIMISPSSFTLKKGFIIPVEVSVQSDGTDRIVPISFGTGLSGTLVTGIIELQGQNTSQTTLRDEMRNNGQKNENSSLGKEMIFPYSVIYTVNELQVLSIEPPTHPFTPLLAPKTIPREPTLDIRSILSISLFIVAFSSIFLGVMKKYR